MKSSVQTEASYFEDNKLSQDWAEDQAIGEIARRSGSWRVVGVCSPRPGSVLVVFESFDADDNKCEK
jgi:hypothetical protein